MDYMEDKMKAVNYNPRLRLHLFIVLVVSALISIFFGGYFTRFFIAEIAILSIFAMSLDLAVFWGNLAAIFGAISIFTNLESNVDCSPIDKPLSLQSFNLII